MHNSNHMKNYTWKIIGKIVGICFMEKCASCKSNFLFEIVVCYLQPGEMYDQHCSYNAGPFSCQTDPMCS
jgi:hypothetical protein